MSDFLASGERSAFEESIRLERLASEVNKEKMKLEDRLHDFWKKSSNDALHTVEKKELEFRVVQLLAEIRPDLSAREMKVFAYAEGVSPELTNYTNTNEWTDFTEGSYCQLFALSNNTLTPIELKEDLSSRDGSKETIQAWLMRQDTFPEKIVFLNETEETPKDPNEKTIKEERVSIYDVPDLEQYKNFRKTEYQKWLENYCKRFPSLEKVDMLTLLDELGELGVFEEIDLSVFPLRKGFFPVEEKYPGWKNQPTRTDKVYRVLPSGKLEELSLERDSSSVEDGRVKYESGTRIDEYLKEHQLEFSSPIVVVSSGRRSSNERDPDRSGPLFNEIHVYPSVE